MSHSVGTIGIKKLAQSKQKTRNNYGEQKERRATNSIQYFIA